MTRRELMRLLGLAPLGAAAAALGPLAGPEPVYGISPAQEALGGIKTLWHIQWPPDGRSYRIYGGPSWNPKLVADLTQQLGGPMRQRCGKKLERRIERDLGWGPVRSVLVRGNTGHRFDVRFEDGHEVSCYKTPLGFVACPGFGPPSPRRGNDEGT